MIFFPPGGASTHSDSSEGMFLLQSDFCCLNSSKSLFTLALPGRHPMHNHYRTAILKLFLFLEVCFVSSQNRILRTHVPFTHSHKHTHQHSHYHRLNMSSAYFFPKEGSFVNSLVQCKVYSSLCYKAPSLCVNKGSFLM